MIATELRIGNWVKVRKGKVLPITIHDLNLMLEWEALKYSKTPPIRPIPLTEDWLLKFGGKKDEGNDVYLPISKGIDMRLYIKEDHILECKGQVCPFKEYNHIKCVHQLQNLYFALTGEELIIKQ